MLTEAVKAGGCNAAEATVADGPRARKRWHSRRSGQVKGLQRNRGGGKVVKVAEAGDRNEAGEAVAGGWGVPRV